MAHEYSVQIHDWLTRQIETVAEELKNYEAKGDGLKQNYFKGRYDELLGLRRYLTERIDLDTQKYYR